MFLDANVLIHAYDSSDRAGAASRKLVERIVSGEQNATTSPLVLDEVLYFFLVKRGSARATAVWKNILSLPHLRVLSVDEKAVSFVLGFVENGLDPRDAFHVATMRANAIETICSYDKVFDTVKAIRRVEP